MKYKIVAIMGKAGAGKDSILNMLFDKKIADDNCFKIVSCTSRPPREGEIDGINYHFLTADDFTQQVLNGEMIEATIFRDWCYGTSFRNLNKDKINIGVYNPEGVELIAGNNDIDTLIIYIVAPDKVRLIRQLNREENPDVKEIIRRYSTDENDFSLVEENFSPIIINNDDGANLEDIASKVWAHIIDWAKLDK